MPKNRCKITYSVVILHTHTLNRNADFASVVATGTDLVRAAAAAAYHTFADVRARSAAFNWIYSVLTVATAGLVAFEIHNVLAFIAALVVMTAKLIIARIACAVPRLPGRAFGMARRHAHRMLVVVVIFLAMKLMHGADAAVTGLKLANVARAVQACNLESFHGEAACRVADQRRRLARLAAARA